MSSITAGYHATCRQVRSPNCDRRPDGMAINLLVIHGISLPAGSFGGDGIERLFTNRSADRALAGLRVSAHFLIRRAGELVQFVSCERRAWHAGVSRWRDRSHCNDYSIGVELEGTDTIGYTARQYDRLIELARLLKKAYPTLTAAVGHCHIAPGRKTDPGPLFDWRRLFAGIGRQMDGRPAGK